MKNKKTFIVLAAVLAALLITAAVVYPKLAQKVQPTSPTDAVTESADGTGAESPANPAADFTVYNASGAAVKLSDLRGRPVIINFWATWCPPCRAELPYFNKAFGLYGEDVVFLMVDLTDGNRETQSGAEEFVAENGYSFPVYFDLTGEAASAYQPYSIPQTVAVNAAGEQVFSRIGGLPEQTVLELAAQMATGS